MSAQRKAHVMIGTPAYGGMVHMNYMHAVVAYRDCGIDHTVVSIGNESLITRARNALLATFVEHPEFSHLLFLDADVALPAAGLRRMLDAGRDVIGAPVALKARGPQGQRVFNLGRCVGEDGEWLLVDRIGTAALLLTRTAVDALVADATADGRVYGRMNALESPHAPRIQFDVFRVGCDDGEYLSEDYWVCRELRRLGFAIYVAADCPTVHHGTLEL